MSEWPHQFNAVAGRASRRELLGLLAGGLSAGLVAGCNALPVPALQAEPTPGSSLPTPIPSQFLADPTKLETKSAVTRETAAIRIVVPSLPPDLEPLRDDGELSRSILRTVYDPLVVRDDGGRVVPSLAASYRNVDPLTWRFSLRDKLRFSDGSPVLAEDVRYSIERAAERQAAFAGKSWLASLRRVDILDSATIHVVTKEPDPLVPSRLVLAPVVPRETHRRLGEAEFAKRPVGTGPYRVKELTPERLVLEASEAGWRGRPLARELVIQYQPDPNARAAAVLGGQTDFAYDLPLERVRELKEGTIRIISGPLESTLVVEISYLTGGPMLDRRVRQALNYAVDKQAIVRQQLVGFGQIVQGQLVVPGVSGYTPAVRAYPFDPARSRALLDQASLPAGGLILKLETLGGTYQGIGEVVAAGLNRVGLPTTVELLQPAAHAERAQRGARAPMFLLSLPYSQLLDVDEVYERYLSTAPPESRRFANSEFDDLFNRSRTEVDATLRARHLERMARIFHEEAPVVFLANEFLAHGLAAGLGGFSRQGDGVIEFDKLGASG